MAAAVHSGTEQAKAGVSQQEESQGRSGESYLAAQAGKFLDQHFNWYNYERIVLTDDYLPYSFFFEGYMVQGAKTCGGVILHGEENIQTAKYGIHT